MHTDTEARATRPQSRGETAPRAGCPFRNQVGPVRDRVIHISIPLARACFRNVSFRPWKRLIWNRLIGPRLAWHAHPFEATTDFGYRMRGDAQDILDMYIYYFGRWEPNLSRWIERSLKPGDTFVDVGANIGYFTLLASRCVGESGRVVAIEPAPEHLRALESNLRLNSVGNVRIVEAAVSDRRSTATLFSGPECHSGLSTIIADEASRQGLEAECEVPTVTLSDTLDPDELESARIVKIDVEGSEWPVVNGMDRLLSSGRRDLEVMVEVAPERMTQYGKSPDDMIRLFSENGFNSYRVENDYTPEGYIKGEYRPPSRVRTEIDWETDMIFSRQDAEFL